MDISSKMFVLHSHTSKFLFGLQKTGLTTGVTSTIENQIDWCSLQATAMYHELSLLSDTVFMLSHGMYVIGFVEIQRNKSTFGVYVIGINLWDTSAWLIAKPTLICCVEQWNAEKF